MVDYCDRSIFGVRYKAVLSEDRLGRGQNHVDSLASFRGFCPEVLGSVYVCYKFLCTDFVVQVNVIVEYLLN